MTDFTFYEDTSGEWRWRLVADNGNGIADSGEGYVRREACEAGATLFQKLGPNAPIRDVDSDGAGGDGPEFEVYTDNADEFRWRFQAGNNRILADGSEGYSSKSAVKEAVERVKAPLRALNERDNKGSENGGFVPPKDPSDPGRGRFA